MTRSDPLTSFPSPACGRGQGEGKHMKRFHKIALTPALSREAGEGEKRP